MELYVQLHVYMHLEIVQGVFVKVVIIMCAGVCRSVQLKVSFVQNWGNVAGNTMLCRPTYWWLGS